MASIVQRLARQARLTFAVPPRAGEEPGRCFLENLAELRSLMTAVRAADLRLVPVGADPCLVPVSYMHICESELFSMGVFVLRPGARIPLHDHPDMHGLLKVLYGAVRVSALDRPVPVERGTVPEPSPLLRSVLRSSGVYTEHSGPCVLSPDRDNLHRIEAVGGPSAFLDILAPPYDPDQGRDCHYYRVVSGPGSTEPAEPGTEVWVTEVSQPEDFRCGGEQYPGPAVWI